MLCRLCDVLHCIYRKDAVVHVLEDSAQQKSDGLWFQCWEEVGVHNQYATFSKPQEWVVGVKNVQRLSKDLICSDSVSLCTLTLICDPSPK